MIRQPNAFFSYLILLITVKLLLTTACVHDPNLPPGNQPIGENLIPQERFYRDGRLLATYAMTADSLIQGVYQEYDTTGKLHRRMNYEGGRIHGLYEVFYASGQLASKHVYDQGYAHGPYTWYYEDGQPQQEGQKEWGKTQGPIKLYYPNGNLQSQYVYVNERRSGPAFDYYPDGKLHLFTYYDQDRDRIFYIQYREDGSQELVFGQPFADIQAEFNRLTGKFALDFNLVMPPGVVPDVKLLRRQDDKAWLCPITSDSVHYRYREPLPDDFVGRYQLLVSYTGLPDSLVFQEDIYVRNNEVYFDEPLGVLD